MLAEFKAILSEQIKDNDDIRNREMTKGAIALLEQLDQNVSFKNVLAKQIEQKA